MEYCAPKLEKLRRCLSCPALLGWCSGSGRRQPGCRSRSSAGDSDDNVNPVDQFEQLADEPWWLILWRKLKKEICPSPESIAYDPYTYSQNFDQGLTWLEPDNLSRSFSMRFAAYPSARFQEID